MGNSPECSDGAALLRCLQRTGGAASLQPYQQSGEGRRTQARRRNETKKQMCWCLRQLLINTNELKSINVGESTCYAMNDAFK